MYELNIILMVLGALVLAFLFLRSVVLWYFKINERLELQQKQYEALEDILQELRKQEKEGVAV